MSALTISVVAGVLVRDGHIFIAKRNPGGPAGGKWEFPGGKIESREEPKAALVRELMEELGLEVIVDEAIGCYETMVAGKNIALDCYWVSDKGGEIKLSSHSEFRWIRPDELLSVDFAEPDVPVVSKILADLPEHLKTTI